MSWIKALKGRRPRFGETYVLLVVSMVLATIPLSILLGGILGSIGHDPIMGVGFALTGLVVLPVLAGMVTLVVGPFYLAWLDVLLRPKPPCFRWPYAVFVIGPGVPGVVMFTVVGVFGGPAYPAVHLGVPSIIYIFEVVVGGGMFAHFLFESRSTKG